MSRNLSWRSGYNYCEGVNRNGKACGNTVPKGFRKCAVHRRLAERERLARASQRAHKE